MDPADGYICIYLEEHGQGYFIRLQFRFGGFKDNRVLFSPYRERRYWISAKLKKTNSQSCFWHTLCTEKLGRVVETVLLGEVG